MVSKRHDEQRFTTEPKKKFGLQNAKFAYTFLGEFQPGPPKSDVDVPKIESKFGVQNLPLVRCRYLCEGEIASEMFSRS